MELAFQIAFAGAAVLTLAGMGLLLATTMWIRADDRELLTLQDWGRYAVFAASPLVITSALRGRLDTLLLQDSVLLVANFGLAGAALHGFAQWRDGRSEARILEVVAIALPLVGGFLGAWGVDML